MNDKQIDAMLSDIIAHADYDLWKAFFSRHPEDPELAEATREELREVARRHIEKAAEGKKRLQWKRGRHSARGQAKEGQALTWPT